MFRRPDAAKVLPNVCSMNGAADKNAQRFDMRVCQAIVLSPHDLTDDDQANITDLDSVRLHFWRYKKIILWTNRCRVRSSVQVEPESFGRVRRVSMQDLI